jgi:acetyl esterase/lipase
MKSVQTRPVLRPWMADIFDSAYVPDRAERTDPLVSPANKADTADLTGIAPALVITAELDLLQEEGARYAERLAEVGALALPGQPGMWERPGTLTLFHAPGTGPVAQRVGGWRVRSWTSPRT